MWLRISEEEHISLDHARSVRHLHGEDAFSIAIEFTDGTEKRAEGEYANRILNAVTARPREDYEEKSEGPPF
jgi:hypothetical protein